MRPKAAVLTLPATNVNDICANQTTAGAGNLLINGSAAVNGVVTRATALKVALTSTGALGGINFTITGLDENGNAQSETIAGPSNNTVYSAKYYSQVSQIAVNGAVGTNVSAGIGLAGAGSACVPWIPVDHRVAHFNVALGLTLSGTINVTVQKTFDDVCGGVAPSWQSSSVAALVNATGSVNGAETIPCTAFRLIVNSYATGATATLNVIQGWSS